MNLSSFFRQSERQPLAVAKKQILHTSRLGKGIFLFLILLFGHYLPASAQRNFSVKVIAQVSPPNSPYLADYQYGNSLSLHILLRGRTFYQGVLKIRLESLDGRGIIIQTRATYNPILDLGPSQTLTGVELAPYFAQENLDFIGYDRQAYLRTKRIPSGIYRLSFFVQDAIRRDVLVSNRDILSQKTLRILALSPPIINLPLPLSTVNPSNLSTQPVPINWTRPANTPFSPEYELIINELRPTCQSKYEGIDPHNAAASRISQGELFNCLGPEIYRTTTTALNYNYGMQAEPLLKLGAWYAARIRARDPQGRTLFINNGVSKIRVFRYGKPCPVPPRVKVTAQSPYQVQLDWDALPNHTGYTVYSKRQGERYRWYKQTALSNRAQVKGLESGIYYSFRVTADCNASTSKESATYDIRMPNVPPSPVECGKTPAPIDLSNQNPIQNLKVGDKIMAADFAFTLVEVRPLGGGYFAGKAYTKIKLFKGARVFARFERIRVNTDHRLIAGELTTDGVGTQVIPEEWSQKYLSFTNEINHLFGEIAKGLDKVDEVLGKIDEVLKKVEEWVQNYQGEDKQELLETIRIGKKEIEEGKKKLKEGDTKEGLKKLKDGSGKVLGVAGKMAKETLEKLWRELKDLFKKIIEAIKGDDEKEQQKRYGEMNTLSVTIDQEVEKMKRPVPSIAGDPVKADSSLLVMVNSDIKANNTLLPEMKVYLEAKQQYGKTAQKYQSRKIRVVLLVELLQKTDKLAQVIQQIKDKAVHIVKEYDTLKKSGKTEAQIIAGLKGLVEGFLNQVVVTPFFNENKLKK